MNRVSAFVVAPVPAAVVGGTVAWTSGSAPRLDAVIFFYLLLLYAFQLLFGLALVALLVRAGKAGAIGFTLAGIAMVAIPAVPYILWSVARHPDLGALAPNVLGLWLAMGALDGLAVWLLTGRGRPPQPPPPDADALRGTFS